MKHLSGYKSNAPSGGLIYCQDPVIVLGSFQYPYWYTLWSPGTHRPPWWLLMGLFGSLSLLGEVQSALPSSAVSIQSSLLISYFLTDCITLQSSLCQRGESCFLWCFKGLSSWSPWLRFNLLKHLWSGSWPHRVWREWSASYPLT